MYECFFLYYKTFFLVWFTLFECSKCFGHTNIQTSKTFVLLMVSTTDTDSSINSKSVSRAPEKFSYMGKLFERGHNHIQGLIICSYYCVIQSIHIILTSQTKVKRPCLKSFWIPSATQTEAFSIFDNNGRKQGYI